VEYWTTKCKSKQSFTRVFQLFSDLVSLNQTQAFLKNLTGSPKKQKQSALFQKQKHDGFDLLLLVEFT